MQEEGVTEKRPRTEKTDTETEVVGQEEGTSQSKYEKGHMTNTCFTDSDEEAIVDFLKDHEELYDKTNDISRTKQGRSVSESGLPTVASCLSRYARPGLTHKGHIARS